MNNRTQTGPRICSALVIALAAGIAWGFVTVWCGYIVYQFLGTTEQVYESVQVAGDGTPVIQSYTAPRYQDQTYRTLDGQPYDPVNQQWLTAASSQGARRPPRLYDWPITWSQRVAGISDMQRHPVSWYFVRDAAPLGHAYFVGFDELSRMRVGYIGRQGFRRAMPPQDEWFDVGPRLIDWQGQALVSTSYIQPGNRAYEYQVEGESMRIKPWKAFVIDGNRLVEIDLRTHTVRTLYESPDIRSVVVVTEPPASAKTQPAPENPPDADDPDALPKAPDPLLSRLALRLADRIVVLDPPTGNKREFILPESLRERPIETYILGADELLVQTWPKERSTGIIDLTWVKPDGAIARQQTLTLASAAPESERAASLMAAGVAPVPLGWLTVLTIVAPVEMLQSNDVATYSAGLAKSFGFGWPGLLVVIAVAVVLAWVTYRLQRKYRRPATGAWTALVLLLGVPGFIAYWLEHHRTKLESCKACGEIIPRDRDDCAACNAQFPTPSLVGTEIFA